MFSMSCSSSPVVGQSGRGSWTSTARQLAGAAWGLAAMRLIACWGTAWLHAGPYRTGNACVWLGGVTALGGVCGPAKAADKCSDERIAPGFQVMVSRG